MTEAEKFACEREARHDVAARGRIADIAPVQHYLPHARTEDGRHHRTAAQRRAAQQPRRYRPAVGLAGWLRWGEDDPSGRTPVIPIC
jgi:hypothetical protein